MRIKKINKNQTKRTSSLVSVIETQRPIILKTTFYVHCYNLKCFDKRFVDVLVIAVAVQFVRFDVFQFLKCKNCVDCRHRNNAIKKVK